MDRREFVGTLAGGLLAAEAQQATKVPRPRKTPAGTENGLNVTYDPTIHCLSREH